MAANSVLGAVPDVPATAKKPAALSSHPLPLAPETCREYAGSYVSGRDAGNSSRNKAPSVESAARYTGSGKHTGHVPGGLA